jgi:hypothetical protein
MQGRIRREGLREGCVVKSLLPQLTNANKNGTTPYSFDIWWIFRGLERTGVLNV